MTQTELAAGRALDAMIAEKVMDDWYRPEPESMPVCRGFVEMPRTPNYSTDIAAAWLVVEHMRGRGCEIALMHEQGKSQQWVCSLTDDEWFHGEQLAPTAPLAICRAALAAVGAGR